MVQRGWWLGLVGLLAVGCGDGSDSDDPSGSGGAATGGSGNSGVTGGASTGGGGTPSTGGSATGGANDGALRAAISLNFIGSACGIADHYIDVPEVSGQHPVTATAVNALVADQERNADGDWISVDCTWRGDWWSGGIGVGYYGAFFSMSGSNVVGDTDCDGVTFAGPNLPEQYGEDATNPCVYSILEADEATHTLWGEFSCGTLDNETNVTACSLGPSYFYFENCPEG